MTNITNLETIVAALPAGVQPKITVLRTRGPRKGELVCERVGGAKTAYRPAACAGSASRHSLRGDVG